MTLGLTDAEKNRTYEDAKRKFTQMQSSFSRRYVENDLYFSGKTKTDLIRDVTENPALTDEEAMVIYEQAFEEADRKAAAAEEESRAEKNQAYAQNASALFTKPAERLSDPQQNIFQMIHTLTGGNIGSSRVLTKAIAQTESVDPDNMLGAYGLLINVDMAGIHDHKAWTLYQNMGHSTLGFITAIRANQLGIIETKELHEVAAGRAKLDMKELTLKIQEKFPRFAAVNNGNNNPDIKGPTFG